MRRPHLDPRSDGMERSARWLILAGYAAPLALIALAAAARPRGSSDVAGNVWFVLWGMAAMGLGGLLLFVGSVVALNDVVRKRGRVRWFDYLLLAAALPPLAGILYVYLAPA